MQAQFLSDGSDFRTRGGGQLARRSRTSGMFWWTLLITLLIGLAAFCWIFSIMVFAYPEKPFNYHLLTKLKKLDPLVTFEREKVPTGDAHAARDLLAFSDLARERHYSAEQLSQKNALWKRAYIFNYKEEKPDYVKGTFVALAARPLTNADVMSPGWVVRARSVDVQDVEIELLLPGARTQAAPYQPGDQFTLDKRNTFAAILHVQRTESDGICATVVPIVYGSYTVASDSKLLLSVPDKLNMKSRWPLTETVNIPVATKIATKSGN
jgi:hypothetical protein